MNKITKNLKTIREKKELSQKEMGEIIETTQQQYQLYESGKREIKPTQIKKICKKLNVSANYILGLIDEPKPLK